MLTRRGLAAASALLAAPAVLRAQTAWPGEKPIEVIVPYPPGGGPAAIAAAAGPDVDGVMTLYPLPAGVDPVTLAEAVGPARDVDGLHPANAGLLGGGSAGGDPMHLRPPATAWATLLCARALGGRLRGAEVVIVGASRIVGRPLAQLLLSDEATVTVCHAATRDLAAHCARADILVTAAGVPGLIGRDHIRPGAIVLDLAVVPAQGGLRGDVDRAAAEGRAAVLSHVPDGVGPVTAACLMHNIATAAGAACPR